MAKGNLADQLREATEEQTEKQTEAKAIRGVAEADAQEAYMALGDLTPEQARLRATRIKLCFGNEPRRVDIAGVGMKAQRSLKDLYAAIGVAVHPGTLEAAASVAVKSANAKYDAKTAGRSMGIARLDMLTAAKKI